MRQAGAGFRWGLNMRKALVLSTALTLGVLNPVFAGGPVVVVPEEPPVVAEKPRSGGILLPLLLVAVIVAVAAGGDDDDEGQQVSDIRLKQDVRRVGTNHLGLGVYQWRYDGLEGVWQGVMAHEVAVMHPGAVKTLPMGYRAVNYARLGLQMQRVA
jgi:hypothetical protein